MKTMKKMITLFAVAALVLALAPAAQAAPVPPFGHAGGYRYAFITDAGYVADQALITTYDGYVEAEAQAAGSLVIGITGWKVIGATAGLNGRSQTDTVGSGGANDVPIYNVNGVRIADGNAHLWGTTFAGYLLSNADSLLSPINIKPNGTINGADRSFTGIYSDGTAHATAALGQASVVDGDPRQVDIAWSSRGNSPTAAHIVANNYNGGLPLYALSPVLTAVAPTVPTILISGSSTVIYPGDTTPSTGDATDFGSPTMGDAPIVKTYTVSNFGTSGTLTLSAPTISGSGAFAVTTPLSSLSLTPGQTATFTVTYTVHSDARSVDDAKVRVASNAAENNPYDFDITATTLNVGVITTPGDGHTGPYRIAFVTLGKRGAKSTDIADYNDFVTTEAGSIPQLHALGVEWKCIGSTLAVSAKTNTSTHTTGDANDVPIYTTTGQLIATNNADLWDGFILAGINFGDGSLTSETGCWTGTKWDGEPDDYTGDPSGPLGTGLGGSDTGVNANISIGNASRINNGWIKAGNSHDGEIDGGSTAERYFMGLSGVINPPPAGTVIIIK